MKKATLIASMIIFSLFAKGQENRTEFSLKDHDVVVNSKMIERFNNYQPKVEYISLFDVYKNLQGLERIEFLREYKLADLEYDSFLDIKNRMLSTIAASELSSEEIEQFIRIKSEINRSFSNNSLARLKIKI
jgi:hypothetical protein